MSVAGVVIFLPDEPPRPGARPKRGRAGSSSRPKSRALGMVCGAASAADLDELVVVISDEGDLAEIPDSATVLLDESRSGEAGGLRSAVDWCGRAGHESLVIAVLRGDTLPGALGHPGIWRTLARTAKGPIGLAVTHGDRLGLVKLDADVWPMIPLEGALAPLWDSHSELVVEVEVQTSEEDGAAPVELVGAAQQGIAAGGEEGPQASESDTEAVARLLGRQPQGRFSVAVRDRLGQPVVIENAPFLDDGTPMPTRYWLVGRAEQEAVSRLESTGGAKAAEAALTPELVEAAHRRYAEGRDALIDPSHQGPRPSGGVGGTRHGVKCLHAHLAWYLAGGADPVGAWVTAQIGQLLDGPVASIDCGTNSTRLLVVSPEGTSLAREMTITRLGQGVDRTGALSAEAVARTVAALASYRQICDRLGVVRLRATATSAARDATNADEFFAAATAVLGVRPELIEGTEEGRLSYLGATAGLSGGPYLVVDLGGGSTELITGDGATSPAGSPVVVSLDVGCVRITERYLRSDPPLKEEIDAARAYVAGLVREALATAPELASAREMIGVAGTVSSLTSLALGLEHYDNAAVHHQRLQRDKVEELLAELAAEPLGVRQAHSGLEVDRADVIVGGALVLAEVMLVSGHDELIHSETDILDGIAAELLSDNERARPGRSAPNS